MDDNSDTRNFQSYIWNKITELKSWNGQHRLLPTTDSPTISASTTATNLSFLENQKFNQRMSTYEENLRTIQPEVIPLQNNEKQEFQPGTNNSINNCSSSNSNIYNTTTIQGPKIFTQVITSISVSLVSMVVGFVSAYTSPAMESLQNDLHVSNKEFSWVGGLMPLGALCGGLFGGQSIELIGRKWTILATDLLFVISWIFIALASNIWLVYCGRAIAGFAVGIGSLAFPVYLGETIQPEVRGTLGLLPTALGNIGILLSFVIGMYIPWKSLAWVGVALPVPFLLMAFFVPESPRWYISKGKVDRAQNTLQWLRGKHTDIHEELGSLAKSQKEAEQSPSFGVSILMKKANLKPLFISLGLMFFQQLSGINAVIFYSSSIFDMAGSTIDKGLCTIIVGIVNFISTFIATVLIDRLGRKVLLYISSVTMTITSGILGTYFYLSAIETNVTEYGWLPLVSFIIYVLGFSLGFGPIPWLMLGEIFPARIRGLAASVATSFNWMCTFIVTTTFVNITDSIGPHGAFWMFAIICAIALVFVVICVPETQGQSLQDIERKLAGFKVRRMSSVANLKPLPSTF